MKKVLAILIAAVFCATFSVSALAGAPAAPGEAPAGASVEAPGAGESEGGPAGPGESAEGESGGESAEGESGGESEGGPGSGGSPSGPAEPTYSASAEENPEQAITLDGVAMGQVQKLITTASLVYDGGELDETFSTMEGVTEEDGVTPIKVAQDNVNGIVIRNTGAFVLGGESDPALVAEKINFSYITSSY